MLIFYIKKLQIHSYKIVKNLSYIIHAYFALFSLPFVSKKENLWLIGGHNGMLYTDNAKVFYEYILQKHPEIEIYWIISKDSSVQNQIKGKKLVKGSIKAYAYFYRSRVVCFSDTLNSDIAPLTFILPWIRNYYRRTLKVYLSHGTIAFKKMPQFSGKKAVIKKEIFKSYDLAIASSELSKNAMIGYHIRPSSIVIAGSARHDTLRSLSSTQRIILVAPTWREWLFGSPSLKQSHFFEQYQLLLSDTKLLNALQDQNVVIHFYLHHMFHHYMKEFLSFENKQVKILSSQSNISKEIMEAEMMVTDYSSICSDFYYLQKPVLFFQFDRNDFLRNTGSEIDLEHDIFGEVSFDVATLREKILTSLKTKSIFPAQKEGEKFFIYYTDKNNCSRIFNTILSYQKKGYE